MILNRQTRVRIPRRNLELFLRRLRGELGLAKDAFTVCVVSDAEIARMNREFRHKSGPTDVLSFPAEKRNGKRRAPGAYAGDIAISADTARRDAARGGRSLATELRMLVLHGALHLKGHDHETDHGEMNRLETRLRRRLGLA